jgi:poly-gamma-glutamate system protein
MKRVYWRPRAVSQAVVMLIAVLSIVGLLAVEFFKARVRQPFYLDKMNAVSLAQNCMDTIKEKRLALGYEIDPDTDPAQTGMIGKMISEVTTIAGHLPSKQTSTNPNFAAVVVDMLKKAGVNSGDLVAVGCSGSFPALNTSVYAALETLDVKPVIIASAGASQFGANFPDLLWIDMERELHEAGLISFRSAACSIGGYEDLGLGMPKESKELIEKAIKERNSLTMLEPEAQSQSFGQQRFQEAIDKRMSLYEAEAGGSEYKAYINVGGGTISVGRSVGKRLFDPGLNLRVRPAALQVDSVMSRFMSQGVPVLHLVQVDELATFYELPLAPIQSSVTPEGNVRYEGSVFERLQYRRGLAITVLIVLLVSLRALVLTDLGFRLFRGGIMGLTPHARRESVTSSTDSNQNTPCGRRFGPEAFRARTRGGSSICLRGPGTGEVPDALCWLPPEPLRRLPSE